MRLEMDPTTDRLRHDIDSGRAGDKVAFPDPAAAPLGTDDEAGGTAPTGDDVAAAHAAEIRQDDGPSGPAASEERHRTMSGSMRSPLQLGPAVAVALAVVLLAGVVAMIA
jgi:hypothetical protein